MLLRWFFLFSFLYNSLPCSSQPLPHGPALIPGGSQNAALFCPQDGFLTFLRTTTTHKESKGKASSLRLCLDSQLLHKMIGGPSLTDDNESPSMLQKKNAEAPHCCQPALTLRIHYQIRVSFFFSNHFIDLYCDAKNET